jgi:hypothetical protein
MVKLLNNAIANLKNDTAAGVKQLKAVNNQVHALEKSHKLDSVDTQTLIRAINEAIAAVLASPI